MRGKAIFLGLSLIFAGTAGGKIYVDEHFDGPGLPEGWSFWKSEYGYNSWGKYSGPWGDYISIYTSSIVMHSSGCGVYSQYIRLAAGTYQYKFQARIGSVYNVFYVGATFYVYDAGLEKYIVTRDLLAECSGWTCIAGDFSVSNQTLVSLGWRVSAGASMSRTSDIALWFDEVTLCTGYPGVGATSLGRVKALFR